MNIGEDIITIRQPDDWHAHLREGNLLHGIINLFNIFGRVVCMGNLEKPIDTLASVQTYWDTISSYGKFQPIIGLMLTKNSRVEEWKKIFDWVNGRVFVKYIPKGVSTNSDESVSWQELKNFYPLLRLAESRQIPILLHAEIDKYPETGEPIAEIDQEEEAIHFVAELAEAFPRAIINVEHVSTYLMIELIKFYNNLSGSISPNHIFHSYNHVFGRTGKLINVHKYFKPVAKLQADISAVIQMVLSGDPQFFFASDCAPHFRTHKKRFHRAGAFNGLTNLAYLCEFFEQSGELKKFQPFVSENGAKRYNLPLNTKEITLKRQYWEVPRIYNGIVPDLAGQTMRWRVVE